MSKEEATPKYVFLGGSAKNNVMPYRVLHDFGIVSELEMLHDAILMKGNRTGGQIEFCRHLFHGSSFGEQLQNVYLSFG